MSLIMDSLGPSALELVVSGRLEKVDYQRLAEVVERKMADGGRVGLVIYLARFQGWTPGALWEDLKFDVDYRHPRPGVFSHLRCPRTQRGGASLASVAILKSRLTQRRRET
jgi:hypothetical protein